jgi:hypothetical protein
MSNIISTANLITVGPWFHTEITEYNPYSE